ncbi:hypothetical protein [Methanospirillum sp.]
MTDRNYLYIGNLIFDIFGGFVGIPALLFFINIYLLLFLGLDIYTLWGLLIQIEYRIWWLIEAITNAVIGGLLEFVYGEEKTLFFRFWPILIIRCIGCSLFWGTAALFIYGAIFIIVFVLSWFLNSPSPNIFVIFWILLIIAALVGTYFPIKDYLKNPESSFEICPSPLCSNN